MSDAHTTPASFPRDPACTPNAGAWFGAQIGSTIWMLPAAAVAFAEHPAPVPGAIILALFAAANAAGAVLWRRVVRGRIGFDDATQLLIAAAGAAALGTLVTAEFFGLLGALWTAGWPRPASPRWAYAFLLLFPALMAVMHLAARRRARAQRAGW